MLEVPPHLFQPLHIDTNINYDLDMSKFPGLDDPQQMYQPALLIATDWNDYGYDEAETCLGDHSVFNTEQDTEDDLFSLIESCSTMFPNVHLTDVDPDMFISFMDDVITGSACYELDISDVITDIIQMSEISDTSDFKDIVADTVLDLLSDADCITDTDTSGVLCMANTMTGQKRRRLSDSDCPVNAKRSKMEDFSFLDTLVSVCRTSRNCEMYREC